MDPVLIAGAGIGGLTLAAGLAGRGIPAVVLEQAEQLAPVGAGLTVQPNALIALRRLVLQCGFVIYPAVSSAVRRR
ncbi:FAD-dependent monooxygenase [Streptomyces sp. NPDC006971]|uniref:FAD-dependent monooxygenase n=1 Tax=Streptomyces sp. NPDC006971 TaxID=3154784 RepID=UPI0033CEEEB4